MMIYKVFSHFIIYGCIGIFAEVLWTGFSSLLNGDKKLYCHTYLWMFFIYGTGILLEPLHEFIRPVFWIYRGFFWATVIFIIEYVTGFILERAIGECPWNYEGETIYTVRGYIRYDFLPVWFSLGLIYEKIHDLILFI